MGVVGVKVCAYVCVCVYVYVKLGVLKLIENSFVGIDEDWNGRNDGVGSI